MAAHRSRRRSLSSESLKLEEMRPMFPGWLVTVMLMFGTPAAALAERSDVQVLADQIDSEWAEAFYNVPEDQKVPRLKELLVRAQKFRERFPKRAEPLILEAILLCSLAGVDWGINSLAQIEQSRDLLIKSIDLDPRAMDAAAYITLGNFYFRLPGWPLSFGDDRQARQYLQSAVALFPDAIDSNYFMGDFLLDQGEYAAALPYLDKAEHAPVRPYQRVSDTKLKEQLPALLKAARNKGDGGGDFFSGLLPAFGSP